MADRRPAFVQFVHVIWVPTACLDLVERERQGFVTSLNVRRKSASSTSLAEIDSVSRSVPLGGKSGEMSASVKLAHEGCQQEACACIDMTDQVEDRTQPLDVRNATG